MAGWKQFEADEPAFAARVRALLDAHRHKTIATLRADGSPRISGIETAFDSGELTFGSMPNSRKGADLRRDPRFALHVASADPPEDTPADWGGDAKVAGRAVWAGELDGEVEGDAFRADLTEVVLTALNEAGDALRVDFWHEGRGLRRIERA
ncbi:MAG: pyridoxamine 5'-phosphate oxidase family protein [Pseudonocardia sp.]|nr:pyridoxamine 5'-phosphate oxidase family protein [Pseudonocardia sp.]